LDLLEPLAPLRISPQESARVMYTVQYHLFGRPGPCQHVIWTSEYGMRQCHEKAVATLYWPDYISFSENTFSIDGGSSLDMCETHLQEKTDNLREDFARLFATKRQLF